MITTLLAGAALAQELNFQDQHGDWRVFTRGEGADRVCYTTTRPTETRPEALDHGDVYFLVASWANGAAEEQPSFISGAPLRPANPPVARIGGAAFQMFASGNEGFIEALDQEARLVREMRRGATMRVEAPDMEGIMRVYEFSLIGVTASLEDVARLCR